MDFQLLELDQRDRNYRMDTLKTFGLAQLEKCRAILFDISHNGNIQYS